MTNEKIQWKRESGDYVGGYWRIGKVDEYDADDNITGHNWTLFRNPPEMKNGFETWGEYPTVKEAKAAADQIDAEQNGKLTWNRLENGAYASECERFVIGRDRIPWTEDYRWYLCTAEIKGDMIGPGKKLIGHFRTLKAAKEAAEQAAAHQTATD